MKMRKQKITLDCEETIEFLDLYTQNYKLDLLVKIYRFLFYYLILIYFLKQRSIGQNSW